MADNHRAFRANICLVPIGRNCSGDWQPRTIYQRDTDSVTLHFIARFHSFIILPIYFLFHCQISFIHHSAYLLFISLPDFIHSSFCLSTFYFIARFHSFIILPIYFSFHCQISFIHHSAFLFFISLPDFIHSSFCISVDRLIVFRPHYPLLHSSLTTPFDNDSSRQSLTATDYLNTGAHIQV